MPLAVGRMLDKKDAGGDAESDGRNELRSTVISLRATAHGIQL